jgi:streptogramin lyase
MVWLSDFGANTLVRFDKIERTATTRAGPERHRVQQQADR